MGKGGRQQMKESCKLCKGFIVKNRFRQSYVEYDEVFYMMKDLRKVVVHTAKGEEWEYGKMEELLARMDGRMVRCHHSLAVNMDKIHVFFPGGLELEDGTVLNMGIKVLRTVKKVWESRISGGANEGGVRGG